MVLSAVLIPAESISPLYRIVWISAAVRKLRTEELVSLLTKSRRNNIKNNITGLLLHDQNSFLQIMEGRRNVVLRTYQSRIAPSQLHKNIALLSQTEITERSFGAWAMGFYCANYAALENIPGYRDFRKEYTSFLDLQKNDTTVQKLIRGFQEGRWHLGTSQPEPCLSKEE